MRFASQNAPKRTSHQAEAATMRVPSTDTVRKIATPVAANRRNAGKLSRLRVDSADRANVLSRRDNIHGRQDREAGRLTASRQQHRPVRRAFRILCTTFTCLLLLLSTLSVPSSAGAVQTAVRYGTLKAAGHPSSLKTMECRKRSLPGSAAQSDGSGSAPACLLPDTAFDLAREGAAAKILASHSHFSGALNETRRARAPPPALA